MPEILVYRGNKHIVPAPWSKSDTHVSAGEWAYPGTVLMKCPDPNAAQEWLADPDYLALAEHRKRSARTNLVLVEGIG